MLVSTMYGQIITYVGILLALYSILQSEPLLLTISLALMLSGVLLHYQEQYEVEGKVPKTRRGFVKWRLLELEDRLKKLELKEKENNKDAY